MMKMYKVEFRKNGRIRNIYANGLSPEAARKYVKDEYGVSVIESIKETSPEVEACNQRKASIYNEDAIKEASMDAYYYL